MTVKPKPPSAPPSSNAPAGDANTRTVTADAAAWTAYKPTMIAPVMTLRVVGFCAGRTIAKSTRTQGR